MATNSEGKICAEISRICGDSHAYFECEVDPATNAVVWRLDLYGKARGYQRLAFATHAEAVAELKKFETEIEDAKTKARTILELERVPDDGWYHLEPECFRDRFVRFGGTRGGSARVPCASTTVSRVASRLAGSGARLNVFLLTALKRRSSGARTWIIEEG